MTCISFKAVAAVVLAVSCMMASLAHVAAASDLPIQSNVDHIGFEVADIDRSIKFYVDYFGFQMVRRADYTFSGKETDIKDADLTAAFIWIPGSSAIELIQFRKPLGDGKTRQPKNAGAFHLGVFVKDVRATYKKLSDRGVKFNSEPRLRGGTYTASLSDPDGVTLELMEDRSTPTTK